MYWVMVGIVEGIGRIKDLMKGVEKDMVFGVDCGFMV